MGEVISFAARPFDRQEAMRVIRFRNPFAPGLLDQLRADQREALIAAAIERSRREPAWAERLRRLACA